MKAELFIAINTTSMSISKIIATSKCYNAGIVFGTNNQPLVSCSALQITDFGFAASYFVDGTSGTIFYNIYHQYTWSRPNSIFSNHGPFLRNLLPIHWKGCLCAVITGNGTVLQKIITGSTIAHSMAVDDRTGNFSCACRGEGYLLYTMASSSSSGGASSTSSGSPVSTAITSGATLGQVSNKVALVGALFVGAFS